MNIALHVKFVLPLGMYYLLVQGLILENLSVLIAQYNWYPILLVKYLQFFCPNTVGKKNIFPKILQPKKLLFKYYNRIGALIFNGLHLSKACEPSAKPLKRKKNNLISRVHIRHTTRSNINFKKSSRQVGPLATMWKEGI